MPAITIERITCPTASIFEEEYVRWSKPVILTDALSTSRASVWTPDSIAGVVGTRRIHVARSTGQFSYHDNGSEFTREELTFNDALIQMRTSTNEKYYAMQLPLEESFPELRADVDIPQLVNKNDVNVINIWIGPAGCVTPLHYDASNNMLSQIYGVKRVALCAPSNSSALYPRPPSSTFPHISQVDIRAPDKRRFPMFDERLLTSVVLNPGETLFIPAFWWHHVSTIEFSISLNFWWKTLISQYFVPNALAQLASAYDRNRLDFVTEAGRGDMMEVARFALTRHGTCWVACLCAAAAFDRQSRALLARAGVDTAAIPRRLTALADAVASVRGRTAVEPHTVALWSQLVACARRGNDDGLSVDRVRAMVAQIQRFIDLSVSPQGAVTGALGAGD